jgi:hypothetical protein
LKKEKNSKKRINHGRGMFSNFYPIHGNQVHEEGVTQDYADQPETFEEEILPRKHVIEDAGGVSNLPNNDESTPSSTNLLRGQDIKD